MRYVTLGSAPWVVGSGWLMPVIHLCAREYLHIHWPTGCTASRMSLMVYPVYLFTAQFCPGCLDYHRAKNSQKPVDKFLSLEEDKNHNCRYACINTCSRGYFCQHKTTDLSAGSEWHLGSCYTMKDREEKSRFHK